MRTKNSQPVKRSSQLMAPAKPPGSAQHPGPSAALLQRILPRASVEKANKVFENFSLSKFPKDSLPSNYVHPHKNDASMHHEERIKHVQDFQRKKIEQRIHKLKTAEQLQHKADSKITVTGITVALPRDRIHNSLPSYNKEKGTLLLDELMGLVAKYARGAEFHAKGDPTLNRLAFLTRIEKLKKSLGLDQHGKKKGDAK